LFLLLFWNGKTKPRKEHEREQAPVSPFFLLLFTVVAEHVDVLQKRLTEKERRKKGESPLTN